MKMHNTVCREALEMLDVHPTTCNQVWKGQLLVIRWDGEVDAFGVAGKPKSCVNESTFTV